MDSAKRTSRVTIATPYQEKPEKNSSKDAGDIADDAVVPDVYSPSDDERDSDYIADSDSESSNHSKIHFSRGDRRKLNFIHNMLLDVSRVVLAEQEEPIDVEPEVIYSSSVRPSISDDESQRRVHKLLTSVYRHYNEMLRLFSQPAINRTDKEDWRYELSRMIPEIQRCSEMFGPNVAEMHTGRR